MLGSKQCCTWVVPARVHPDLRLEALDGVVEEIDEGRVSPRRPHAAALWIAGSSIWTTLQPAATARATRRSARPRGPTGSRLSSSYASVVTVSTVEARSAAIVPNFTGLSVLDCATRHTFANSSGTRGPILSTMAWYFQPPTISLSQVPTGYVQPAVVSVSTPRSAQALDGVREPRAAREVEVEVVVAVREDVEASELLVGDHRSHRVEVLLAVIDVPQPGGVRPFEEVPRVPLRSRPRSGHGRRKHEVLRGCRHRA